MKLRNATLADADFVLALRNDPVTRAMSIGRRQVPRTVHEAWFHAHHVDILIAEEKGVKVGVFRSDPSRREEWPRQSHVRAADVSVAVAPEARGRGLGFALIRMGTQAQFRRGYDACVAVIRLENAASLRAFLRAGYEWCRTDDVGRVRVAILTCEKS